MTSRLASIAAHRAWLLTQRPAARAFDRALRDPEAAQRAVLARLIAANRHCAFGMKHAFAKIRSIDDFRAAVPMATYDDMYPWIERAKRGELGVLTTAEVKMFECSSGSAGAVKFIPYTAALLREFQRAIAPWLCDLYDSDSALAHGPAYWSVTPLTRKKRRTEGGVPIGFDSDSEYFGPLSKWFARRLLAVPDDVARRDNIDDALYVTLRYLLDRRSLALLSVWSPSFLTVLCRTLERRGEELVRDLRHRRQAERLRSMLRGGAIEPLRLWPRLRLISCWTSAEARGALGEVRRMFPGVRIQAKGLLATEGVMTIPMRRFGGAVPAIMSHFLEFAGDDGVRLAHELERGKEYSPLLTTGGGLWRYRIGDRVRVTEIAAGIPVLEFVGREDGLCDLRGEKLSPAFVGSVIDAMGLDGTFAMLAPAAQRDSYVLFTDSSVAAASTLDRLLKANPHYAYCRDLGQLRSPEIFRIAGDAHAQYLRHCERAGRRAGAVKLVALDRDGRWQEAFTRA